MFTINRLACSWLATANVYNYTNCYNTKQLKRSCTTSFVLLIATTHLARFSQTAQTCNIIWWLLKQLFAENITVLTSWVEQHSSTPADMWSSILYASSVLIRNTGAWWTILFSAGHWRIVLMITLYNSQLNQRLTGNSKLHSNCAAWFTGLCNLVSLVVFAIYTSQQSHVKSFSAAVLPIWLSLSLLNSLLVCRYKWFVGK